MCHLIVDADSLVYKAAMIAEETHYDILPATLTGIPTQQVIDSMDPDSYAAYLVYTCRKVAEYKLWLKEVNKSEDDFLRVTRVELKPLVQSLNAVNSMLRSMLDAVQPDTLTVLISGKDNFRDKVAKLRPYKESRKDLEKPQYYYDVRTYLIDKWSAVTTNGCEADDMCGILATACEANNTPFVIAGIDKDLLSIPGTHYNYDSKSWSFITAQKAERWFWEQVLTGDSTDCIPGLKGIGPKSAQKILGKARTYNALRDRVRQAYQDAFDKDAEKTTEQLYAGYRSADDLLNEQGQLIHMQRSVGELWGSTQNLGDISSPQSTEV